MNDVTTLDDRPITRDNEWLEERLSQIWYRHFSDVDQPNDVLIVFGRKSRTRLGSIGMDGWQGEDKRKREYRSRRKATEGASVITITGYFTDSRVPEYVVDATIGHELVHYAHGFHSPHPQLYPNPHAGGVVDKEMIKRGMGESLFKQKTWLKQEWGKVIGPPVRRARRRRKYIKLSILPAYLRKKI